MPDNQQIASNCTKQVLITTIPNHCFLTDPDHVVSLLWDELPMKNLLESLQQKFSDNYESWFFVLYCHVIFVGKKVL